MSKLLDESIPTLPTRSGDVNTPTLNFSQEISGDVNTPTLLFSQENSGDA